jgi:putative endonuclease
MIYCVYIMTNRYHTVFYVGVTNDIESRTFEHKIKIYNKSFSAEYNTDKLVYFEEFEFVKDAMHREKQLKKYHRDWKKDLINGMNPDWKDLSEEWYDPEKLSAFRKKARKEKLSSRYIRSLIRGSRLSSVGREYGEKSHE